MRDDSIKSLFEMANTDLSRLYDAQRQSKEPSYQQKKDGWCGPAALAYAFARQGLQIPQEKLAKLTRTTIKNGVEPKYLADEARRFGFNVEILRGEDPDATIEKMDQALLDEKSAIVDYLEGDDINKDGHYVVFQGSTGNRVILWDPSKARNIVLDKKKFIDQWKDKTVGGKVFKYWAMILSKPYGNR